MSKGFLTDADLRDKHMFQCFRNAGIGKIVPQEEMIRKNLKWLHRQPAVEVPECLTVEQYMAILNASTNEGGD
jgi:hypothetical protein